jgi:hypothetical protein
VIAFDIPRSVPDRASIARTLAESRDLAASRTADPHWRV